jgi:hypothetical protein
MQIIATSDTKIHKALINEREKNALTIIEKDAHLQEKLNNQQ